MFHQAVNIVRNPLTGMDLQVKGAEIFLFYYPDGRRFKANDAIRRGQIMDDIVRQGYDLKCSAAFTNRFGDYVERWMVLDKQGYNVLTPVEPSVAIANHAKAAAMLEQFEKVRQYFPQDVVEHYRHNNSEDHLYHTAAGGYPWTE